MKLTRLLSQNKPLILGLFFVYILLWVTISACKQLNFLNRAHESDRLKYRSNSTFYALVNRLYHLKISIILIDPDVLNDLLVHQLSLDKVDKQLITFAILDESIQALFEALEEIPCSIRTSKTSMSRQRTSTDHIFIEYKHKTLHVAVLHKYNSYYRIHENHLSLPNDIHLSWGDKLRAVEPIESELSEYLFYYPRDVSHFLWLYNTSQFVHCNRTLADRMKNEYHIRQSISQLSMIIKPMKNIAYGLEKLKKHYWIAGTALLGWYRHCGIVPSLEDVDFGLYAEEYDESIRNYFLGNPVTYIWAALGLVNDSLEFRLSSGRYVLDLLWTYRDGNHRWHGYQAQRSKYRRTLPLLTNLCSGDLFGYRFSVPCSPVYYFDSEYGKDKWQVPAQKDHIWINMKYHSMWDDISWMYAVRVYTPEGKLRTDEFAVGWISKPFNYSFTSIPSFLNVLPNEPVTLPPLKSELAQNSSVKNQNSTKTSKLTTTKQKE